MGKSSNNGSPKSIKEQSKPVKNVSGNANMGKGK